MDFRSLFDEEFLDGIRKDMTYEVRMVIKTVNEQISTSRTTHNAVNDERHIYFSTNFYTKAEEFGLTEADAIDVYHNGREIQAGQIVRSYNGYEISIEYIQEHFSGKPIITAIWQLNVTK